MALVKPFSSVNYRIIHCLELGKIPGVGKDAIIDNNGTLKTEICAGEVIYGINNLIVLGRNGGILYEISNLDEKHRDNTSIEHKMNEVSASKDCALRALDQNGKYIHTNVDFYGTKALNFASRILSPKEN